jgi:competence protein ComGC
MYYLDKGSYPTSLETLTSDGYINKEQQTCPDGKTLGYSSGKVTKP